MLVKNTNNYNVVLCFKENRSMNFPAFHEMEVEESDVLKLPEGVIKIENNNLLVEPNMYNGKSLNEVPIDTSNLLLEG